MEFRHFRYFVAVAEEKHFGRAAQRLHMAQPPLSAQIKQLESELGTTLFDRTTRRVDLTPAGELLLERAYQILSAVESAKNDVAEVGQGSAGVLRIGFSGTATYELMPEIVRLSNERYPSVRLKVFGEMLTHTMEESLLDGRLDLAVLRPPIESDELSSHEFHQTKLALAISRQHPLAQETGLITPEDVMGVDVVSYPRHSSVASIAMEACRRRGFRPKIVQTASETSTLNALVAANIGVAFVPYSDSYPLNKSMVLRPLLDDVSVSLSIAWKGEQLSPIAKNFVQTTIDASASLENQDNSRHGGTLEDHQT